MKEDLTPIHIICGTETKKSNKNYHNTYYCPTCNVNVYLQQKILCDSCLSVRMCGRLLVSLPCANRNWAIYEYCSNPFCPSYYLDNKDDMYTIKCYQKTPAIRLGLVCYSPENNSFYLTNGIRLCKDNLELEYLFNHFIQVLKNLLS